MDDFHSSARILIALQHWHEFAAPPPSSIPLPPPLHPDMTPKQLLDYLPPAIEAARATMNAHIKSIGEKLPTEDATLTVKQSRINNAGDGLYAKDNILPLTKICYYWGAIHDFHSKQKLNNNAYLLHLGYNDAFGADVFVDPRKLDNNARFINDPRNELLYNVKFVPDPNKLRADVVATREIQSGEELFVDYSDSYWSAQTYEPSFLAKKNTT